MRSSALLAALAMALCGAALAEGRLRDPVGLNEGVAAILDQIDWHSAEVIEIRLEDHNFHPYDLVLERNKPYIFRLRNTGNVSHDMAGGSFFSGIAIKLAQNAAGRVVTPVLRSVFVRRGQDMELWFVPIRAGRYTFFCDIDDHRDQGMEGEITIR